MKWTTKFAETEELPEDIGSRAVDEGRYEARGEVGEGGMGRVELVYDRRLDRLVARKRLRPELASSPGHLRRFWREAAVTARLEHPCIVPLHDAGWEEDGTPYYTMRYLQGSSLARAIATTHSHAERMALLPRILQVAEALSYAHREGVIHRDLKPENILVGACGETQLIDWGIAGFLKEDSPESPSPEVAPDLTRAGAQMGTLPYMSPEQFMGIKATERADVWGLGALLYALFAGSPPYKMTGEQRVPAAPLAAVAPELPPELVAIAERAMAVDPGQRYPSAVEFADDLRRWMEGRYVEAYPYRLRDLLRHLLRRHRSSLRTTGVALLLLGLGLAAAALRTMQERMRAERMVASLLAERAERALEDENRGEAQLLAARSLQIEDGPRARGLALAAGGGPGLKARSQRQLPANCRRLIEAEDGRLLCVESGGVSWWEPTGVLRVRHPSDALEALELVPGGARGVTMRGRMSFPTQGAATPWPVSQSSPVLFGTFQTVGAVSYWAYENLLRREDEHQVRSIQVCAENERVTSMAIHPDGDRYLASCGRSAAMYTGRWSSGSPPLRREVGADAVSDPVAVVYSSATRAIAATKGGQISLLDPDGRVERVLDLPISGISGISGSGAFLVVHAEGQMALLDPERGLVLGRLPSALGTAVEGGQNLQFFRPVADGIRIIQYDVLQNRSGVDLRFPVGLSELCVAPGGAKVAVGAADGRLHVVGLPEGRIWAEHRWQTQVVKACAWSADGQRLAGAGVGSADLWLLEGEASRLLVTPEPVRRLLFDEDGSLWAWVYGRGAFRWLGAQGEPERRKTDGEVMRVVGQPSRGLSLQDRGSIRRLEGDGEEVLHVADATALAAEGDWFAVGKGRAQVDVYDLERAQLHASFPVARGDLWSVALSPDGRLLAAGTQSGRVLVWKLAEQQLIGEIPAHTARIPVLRFTDQALVSVSWDGRLRSFPLAGLEQPATELLAEVAASWAIAPEEVVDPSRFAP